MGVRRGGGAYSLQLEERAGRRGVGVRLDLKLTGRGRGEGGARVQPAIGGEGGEEGAAAAAAAVEQSVLSACSFKTSHQRLCVNEYFEHMFRL